MYDLCEVEKSNRTVPAAAVLHVALMFPAASVSCPPSEIEAAAWTLSALIAVAWESKSWSRSQARRQTPARAVTLTPDRSGSGSAIAETAKARWAVKTAARATRNRVRATARDISGMKPQPRQPI